MPLSMTAPAITSSICFKWILLFVFLVFKSTLGGDQGQEWRKGGERGERRVGRGGGEKEGEGRGGRGGEGGCERGVAVTPPNPHGGRVKARVSRRVCVCVCEKECKSTA